MQSGPPLLIRRAQLPGLGVRDLRTAGGRIVELARQLEPQRGDRIVEAGGNLLLPGLHDHHAHLFATAAARESLMCGPPEVRGEEALRETLARHARSGEGWIRGVGFHDSVYPRLDRHWLDAACAARPVRIQHRSGMLWVLNSCALARLRLSQGDELPPGAEKSAAGELTGRFYDLDEWLGARLDRSWPTLGRLSGELASFGITGVTDAGARNGKAAWEALCSACAHGQFTQRLVVMGNEELDDVAVERPEQILVGPLKIYLRDAELPDFDTLLSRVRTAHARGRAAAFHCVTRVELGFALAALSEAGAIPGDRVEHAAIADAYALETLAALGVSVVTQPHFIVERGDHYLSDVEPDDVALLYRGAGFLRHGVALAAGSDAPYGSTDPWAAMRAAIERRTRDGVAMSSAECLSPSQALALFSGDPHRPGTGMRVLAVGQAADLCLLDAPWEGLRADLDARHVALTVCNGRIAYRREAIRAG
jgi:predicted amidohydrolase YtcJ